MSELKLAGPWQEQGLCKASCNDSFGQSTWHGSLHVPQTCHGLVAWLVWTSLWLLPDSYVLSLIFFDLLHIFGTKMNMGGIHYFSKHKPAGRPEFDMLRTNSWTPGGMLLISNDLLEDIGAPSWVESWEVDLLGWSFWKIMGIIRWDPDFFFWEGIRFNSNLMLKCCW